MSVSYRRLSLVAMLAVLSVGVLAEPRQSASPQAPASATPQQAGASRGAALPAARAVIDRHIEAIGGRAAILARTSTHVTGTVSIPSAGITGSVDVFAATPDKTLMRITLGAVGTIEEGFDGTTGWSISPMTGPSLLQGKELAQKRYDSDFLADLHPDARYESMTTIENVAFDGRPCYRVRLVRRGGGEDIEFYEVASGLKAGGITTRETPMGAITGTTVEADYQRFGPLLQPTKITQTVMGVQQVITVTAVEYDEVAPAVFEPPAAIKALRK